MKNYLLLSLFVLALITSCEKESIEHQQQQDYEFEMPDVNLEQVVNNFENDYATFDTDNDFAAFISKFRTQSDEEKSNLLGNLKFESQEAFINKAYEGMEGIESAEAFHNYIDKYEGYLEIATLPNGEEEVVEMEFSGHTVFPLLNKDRIVKVGDEFQKYIGKSCVKSQDYNELISLRTEAEAKSSGLEIFEAYREYGSTVSDSDVSLRWGDLNVTKEWDEEYDKRWCVNDRKVWLKVKFFSEVQTVSDPFFGTLHLFTIVREARVIPKRKGFPCIWYKYTTSVTWNDFHMEHDIDKGGTITHSTWNEPNITQTTNCITRDDIVDEFVSEFESSWDCQWTDIESNVTTGGMGGNWLEVDWSL